MGSHVDNQKEQCIPKLTDNIRQLSHCVHSLTSLKEVCLSLSGIPVFWVVSRAWGYKKLKHRVQHLIDRHLCFWSHIASLSGFPSFMEQHWLPIKYFQLHILKLHSIPVNTWHISKTENNLPNSIWVWERDYSALKQSTRANGESEHRPLISFWLEVIITLLTDGNLVHEEFMCREKSCEMQLTERY